MSADRTAAQLPPVTQGDSLTQVDYNVRAPAGGLRQMVEAFLGDQHQRSFDIQLTTGIGQFITVRVYPDRQMVVRHTETPDLVLFHGGTCFVVKNGKETGAALTCSGHVNLEVTIAKVSAGSFGILLKEGETL